MAFDFLWRLGWVRALVVALVQAYPGFYGGRMDQQQFWIFSYISPEKLTLAVRLGRYAIPAVLEQGDWR